VIIATLAISPAFGIHKKQLTKLQEEQHKAMHVIVEVERDVDGNPIRGGLCTAYAVSSHTLLTAQHCDLNTNAIYIDTTDREAIKSQHVMSYTILSKTYDNEDHVLYVVSGITFNHTIVLTAHVEVPKQGTHVYQWGNPAGVRDQYREGVVIGSMPNPTPDSDNEERVNATGTVYLIEEPVVGGDSGSAIFSMEDGQLIGVLTYSIDGGQLAGVYAVVFTQAQLDAAGVK
jgi:V8-like Glu-specific endopeptidase